MKKKTFGRVAALGLAGLTVLPAYSMVASAEAYPTYVYEFTYGGIDKTPMYTKNLNSTFDNKYVNFYDSVTNAQKVFSTAAGGGFAVKGLETTFWNVIDAAITASKGQTLQGDDIVFTSVNKDTAGWTYRTASLVTSGSTVVVPQETYNKRAGASLEWTFAFKSKAERDAAMADIAAKNKSEYDAKYKAAAGVLSKDLSSAVTAYKTAQDDLIKKVQAAVNKYFKENPTATECTLNDVISAPNPVVLIGTLKDLGTADDKIYKSAANKPDPRNTTDYLTLNEWSSKQNTFVGEEVTKLNNIAKEVNAEFKEAYQTTNWVFNLDATTDNDPATTTAIPFLSGYGPVATSSVGTFISEDATYAIQTAFTTPASLTLNTDYYRTVGAYVNPDSYAFKGEIIPAANRKYDGTNPVSNAAIEALLLDSDCWSLFSVLLEGKPTDNNNTTEGGTTTTDKDEDEKEKTPDQSAVYKVAGTYYPTYSAAYNAAAGNTDNIAFVKDYVTLPYDYFSNVTGEFYKTYSEALRASNNVSANVTVFNGASTSTNTNTGLDPYYYYFLNQQNGNTNKDTTSATLGNKSGWTSIANYLNKAGSGTSVTVNMNKETTIPSSVLAAIEGKNVTVNFRQSNGASLTVNGKDVADSKNVEVDVTYNTKNVSKKLIQNAFKKNGAVSSAQISIDEGSFGFDSDLTVKFNSKRAGYSAKIYRYNASRNSLQLVDTATVSNSGKTTFNNITKGGEFVIVLFED